MKDIAHFYLYGVVENEPSDLWASEFGSIRSKDVVNFINENKGAKTLMIHINSPGGQVVEGFAIHDVLVNSGKEIITQVEGLCGSIATVCALAGSKRLMLENSEWFIHNPWNIAVGTAAEFQKLADDLKVAEDRIVAFYVSKTGGDEQQLRDLMNDSSTLTSAQALEMKFITEVVTPVKALSNKLQAIQNKMSTTPPKKDEPSGLEQRFNQLLNTIDTKFKEWGIKKNEAPKNLDITLADDKGTLVVDTENATPAPGDSATINGEPANGTYTGTDGSTTVCAEGKVTEYKAAEAAAAEDKAKDEQITALKATIEKQNGQIAEMGQFMQTMNTDLTNLRRNITSNYQPPVDQGGNRSRPEQKDNKPVNRVEELRKKRKAEEEAKNGGK